MPDAPASPAAPAPDDAAPHTQPHGYFNQAQLDDLLLAEQIFAQAQHEPYLTQLATKDLSAAWLTDATKAAAGARDKSRETGQAGDTSKAATLNAGGAERRLVAHLQQIQCAAKQKHRMLAAAEPPVDFPLDGYLIGARLNPSRSLLTQNAEALIPKALADLLPGYKTEADLKPAQDALAAYKQSAESQGSAVEDASTDRIARDKLIASINHRRAAVQHAIDGLHPYTDDANAPVRRLFKIPLNRPFNG